MRPNTLLVLCTLAVYLFLNNEPVSAQSDPPKFEVGTQFSLIRFSDLDITEAGFGARFTYNINKHVAVEAEVNIFPRDPQDYTEALRGGHKTQGLFGLKVGKRSRRFGLFGKVRPGFVNFSHLSRLPECCTGMPPPFEFSETDFALDLGGVAEFYTSRRTFIRVDVGDTIVHSNSGKKISLPTPFTLPNGMSILGTKGAIRSTSHNLQLTVGMGFRLFRKAQRQNTDSTRIPEKRAPRYEVGVQFSSLSINPHSVICFDLCIVGSDRKYAEPGVGVRFTYNLTNNIGLEAEGNLFGESPDVSVLGLRGRMSQGQFGAKVGKRFKRLGVFGKIRPGFVGFSKVSYLVSTSTLTFDFGRQVSIGRFGERKGKFFSTDVGGVVEFYPSRHLMTRVDLGDTIIRYGKIVVPGYSLSGAIQRIPPETRHNFQFTAGIGLRF
ncbi:MAG: outer membrane beta-barrel protein [Acidobacteriota bacterium]